MNNADVLYLLPGLLCDDTIWRHQKGPLQPAIDVRIPNFFGLSSITRMAELVLHDAPATFAIAGHSMGGRVALEIHRLARQRVDRIMLLDTGVAPLREGEPAQRQRLIKLAHDRGMTAMAREWLPGMLLPAHRDDPSIVVPLMEMICRVSPDDFEGEMMALLSRPDAAAELTRITCPTAILCGRDDMWSPPAQHEAMHRQIARSTLTIIENAGHMTPIEQPAAVTAAIKAWLDRAPAPSPSASEGAIRSTSR